MVKKILIVEDSESYLEVLTKKLGEEVFELFTAKDGYEGLEKASEHKPDIIIIDLLMPKMNGIQLMTELRAKDWGKTITFLILTNLNPDEELMKAIDNNKPAYYMIKPQITLDELAAKVREIIENSEATTSNN